MRKFTFIGYRLLAKKEKFEGVAELMDKRLPQVLKEGSLEEPKPQNVIPAINTDFLSNILNKKKYSLKSLFTVENVKQLKLEEYEELIR